MISSRLTLIFAAFLIMLLSSTSFSIFCSNLPAIFAIINPIRIIITATTKLVIYFEKNDSAMSIILAIRGEIWFVVYKVCVGLYFSNQ